MSPLVIISGVRTPFSKAGTALAKLSAADLGAAAVKALLARTPIDPALLSEVIFGCVGQPADAANVARVIALRAGLPQSVPAATVHRNCASGLEALTTAHERLQAGRGDVFVVGGTESMSNYPLQFPAAAAEKFGRLARAKSFPQRLKALAAFRPSDFKPRSALLLGLTDPVVGLNMGETAELLVRDFKLTRTEQDEWAVRSHQKAAAARDSLAAETAPVYTSAEAVTSDNGVRPDSSVEKLAKLTPVFDRKCGTVTAGNASQISDGAVALLVMSEERAMKLGLKPLGRLLDHAAVGCDPRRMGLGPVHAVKALGRPVKDADVVELNEAFAAQVIACNREFGTLPDDVLNPRGGAIALGHPVGASGARLVLSLLHELNRRGGRRGLATLCVGGGQGVAAWFEAT